MDKALKAFDVPIESGLIRIFLRIGSVTCAIENDAPDFIKAEDDHPKLRVIPDSGISELTETFNRSLDLKINKRQSTEGKIVFDVE